MGFGRAIGRGAAGIGLMRLESKVAMVMGAGQTPGETIGNGRATAQTFAREGAMVIAVDIDAGRAAETVEAIAGDGGTAAARTADVTDEASLAAMIAAAVDEWGRVDVLHNNVGVSIDGGDAPLEQLEEAAFDRVLQVNLRGTIMACKHMVPRMRAQGGGAIINIASIAAFVGNYPFVSYKAAKAGLVAFTKQLAVQNAADGIRANVILPGLINTPMAIEPRVRTTNRSRAEVIAERDAQIPLRGGMGSGWDIANAALYLASDEARFVTGVALPVDGGALARVG